jgi:cytoskeletal protein CcmA (bactofilin family)
VTCPDELTVMMFADGEVDDGRRREIQAHLVACARCSTLAASLRSETAILRSLLRDVDDADARAAEPTAAGAADLSVSGAVPSQHTPTRAHAVAAGGAAVLGASLLRMGVDAAAEWSALVLPDWVNPLHAEGRTNAAVNVAWYLVQEGGTVMSSAATTASLFALAVLGLVAASRTATRLRARGLVVLCGLVVLGGLAAPAGAVEIRRAQNGDVTIAAGETIDDTLIAMGDEIDVLGTVTGDLVLLGRRARVRGTVGGNVFAFARAVDIQGTVTGSLFLFGQTLTARGPVRGNLTAVGQTVTAAGTSRVEGNATTFSETATIEGPVGRDVTSFGRRLQIGGTVGRRVTFYGEQIDVRPGARIEGALIASVSNRENVRVDAGATVVGPTNVRIDVDEPSPSRYATAGYYVRQAIRLAAAFVAGWLFFWLVPSMARIPFERGGALLVAAAVGAITIVATPVLAVALGITLVGLPVALFGLMVWLVLLYLAKIVLALHLGRLVLGSAEPGERLVAALLVGLVLVLVAVNLPYVGGLLNVLLTLTGLGVLVGEIRRGHRNRGAAPAAA